MSEKKGLISIYSASVPCCVAGKTLILIDDCYSSFPEYLKYAYNRDIHVSIYTNAGKVLYHPLLKPTTERILPVLFRHFLVWIYLTPAFILKSISNCRELFVIIGDRPELETKARIHESIHQSRGWRALSLYCRIKEFFIGRHL